MKKHIWLLVASILLLSGCTSSTPPQNQLFNPPQEDSFATSSEPVLTENSIEKVQPAAVEKKNDSEIKEFVEIEKISSPVAAPNGTYTNVDGEDIPRPYEAESVPIGATALCRDGTYSFSTHRQGTCSHHGGVAEWY